MFRTLRLNIRTPDHSVPLQAGTIHEVFNQTYTLTGALNTTDLLTPPAVDTSYLITIYYTVSGTSGVGVKDVVSPYFNWTDAAGVEQLGDGLCPWNEKGTPKKCSLTQADGPWLPALAGLWRDHRYSNQRRPGRGHISRPRAGEQPCHADHSGLES